MGTGASKGIGRAFEVLGASILAVGLGISLSGCPDAAPLENEGRFPALEKGPVDCKQALPDGPSVIGCDYVGILGTYCARGGCHNALNHSAELDLTPSDLLIARILEVPSKHIVTCGVMRCDLTNPGCDNCRRCPSGDRDVLLTKADIPNSWIMEKMAAFDVNTPTIVPSMGCGTAMPATPGNSPPGAAPFDEVRRTCLVELFTWIANNGRKCEVASGGSGGGGAGGAGASGAGSGGTGGT